MDNKVPGDGPRMEAAAKAASAGFPTLWGLLNQLDGDKIREETMSLATLLPQADIRVIEGLAAPVAYLRLVCMLLKIVNHMHF